MDSAAIIAEMRRWCEERICDWTDAWPAERLANHMEAWLSEHAQGQECIPGSRIPWSDVRPIKQPAQEPTHGERLEVGNGKCKKCHGTGEVLPSGPSDAPVEFCECCEVGLSLLAKYRLSEHAQPQDDKERKALALDLMLRAINPTVRKNAEHFLSIVSDETPAQEPTDGEMLDCAHCGAPRWIHGRSDYWCPEFKPAVSARTEDQG
jgi:hypothetical protein